MLSATGASRSSAGVASTRAASACASAQVCSTHLAKPICRRTSSASSRPSARETRATGRARDRTARDARPRARAPRAADRPRAARTPPSAMPDRGPACSRRRRAPAPICGNRRRPNAACSMPASSGAKSRRQRRHRAERAVDVEPHALGRAEARKSREIVDRADIDRPRRADHQERRGAVCAIPRHHIGERVEIASVRRRRRAPAAMRPCRCPTMSMARAMQPWAAAEV